MKSTPLPLLFLFVAVGVFSWTGFSEQDPCLPIMHAVASTPLTEVEHALLNKLSQEGQIFGSPDFWNYFEQNRDKFEGRLRSGNWLLRKSDSLNHFIGRMEKLGRFGALAFDPGIACRLTKFEEFIRSQRGSIETLSLAEIRDLFNMSLGGKIHAYRGMMLSEDGAREIDRNGIRSQLFRFPGYNASLATFLFGSRARDVADGYRMDNSNLMAMADARRTQSRRDYDPFISVTTDWQVTHAGAMSRYFKRGAKYFGGPNDRFYRYEMDVDIVDALPMDRTSEISGTIFNRIIFTKPKQLMGNTGNGFSIRVSKY